MNDPRCAHLSELVTMVPGQVIGCRSRGVPLYRCSVAGDVVATCSLCEDAADLLPRLVDDCRGRDCQSCADFAARESRASTQVRLGADRSEDSER